MRLLRAASAMIISTAAVVCPSAFATEAVGAEADWVTQESAAQISLAYFDGYRPPAPKGSTAPIRGRVTDSSNGQPIEFVTAFAFALPNFDEVFTAETDANGEFEIQVPPGDYRVSYAAGDGEGAFLGPYTREQYSDTLDGELIYCDFQNACRFAVESAITVGASGVENIDATLDPAGFIGGMLTDANSMRLDGDFRRRIEITDPNGRLVTIAFQFGAGYGIRVPAGSYVLVGSTSTPLGYIDETHNGTACPRRTCPIESEAPIDLMVGEFVREVDIALDLGAVITGRVIDGTTMNVVPAAAD